MTELLPCPCCGSTATVEPHLIEAGCTDGASMWPAWWTASVNCTFCALQFIGGGNTELEAVENAIKGWNTRAERTCKLVSSKGSDYPPVCSACGYELGIYDCEWFEDGTYGYEGNYCPNCGAKVVGE